MQFDIFLSICQTEVEGYMPNEKQMFKNFFEQVWLADHLGFGTAWVAETHLSCQVQKENPGAVIPHFKGEIGLNTDILQMAQIIFAKTSKINVGSAIRNIICNGGPIAHAEAIRTFLSLNSVLNEMEKRSGRFLEIGFAAGRFPFSNSAYGFYPKTELEKMAWEVIKNKYFQEATEIFLRFLKGERLSSQDISDRFLSENDFRKPDDWKRISSLFKTQDSKIKLDHHWQFEKVGVIPFETSLDHLRLTIGSHDPETQVLANQILPVGVFNLSITPPAVIEETHQRMRQHFHPIGGKWQRSMMPRTVMIFLQPDGNKAKAQAKIAWQNYWKAMEGTLDPKKVEAAVENTIAGDPLEVTEKIKQKYHPDDRLMLWFDFNNHDSQDVMNSMKLFIHQVAPRLS
jgi:alkanesulfonate monooxygenase SsuD/methylene tetrahydromethanopterin reductase-like flavin-dependent oxidoreductase (luciferase family)